MKSKIKISDIFAYLLGNYRLWIYNNCKFLLRSHIIEQYEWRLTKMNPECYTSGSCVKCGCDTPALQMANKACKGGCYFEIYSKKKWKAFKEIVAKRNAITSPLDLLLENLEENDSEEEYVWPIMYKKEVPQYVVGFDPITSNKDSVGVDTTTFKIIMREPWSPENKDNNELL